MLNRATIVLLISLLASKLILFLFVKHDALGFHDSSSKVKAEIFCVMSY